MSDSERLSQSERRRLPSRWAIRVCPGCNGLVGELSQEHLGDCEYRDKIFVPRSVWVRPDVPTSPPLARSGDSGASDSSLSSSTSERE